MLGLTATAGDSIGFSLVSCCRLWEAPHPLHTHIFLSSYMMCFSTFYCGYWSYGCNPSLIYAWSHSHSGCSRTFTGFSLAMCFYDVYFIYIYIYKLFQHLLQWLVVIRMQVQPVICYMGPKSGCCWCRRLVSVSLYDWGPQFLSYSYQGFFIYIKCFSTCYSG